MNTDFRNLLFASPMSFENGHYNVDLIIVIYLFRRKLHNTCISIAASYHPVELYLLDIFIYFVIVIHFFLNVTCLYFNKIYPRILNLFLFILISQITGHVYCFILSKINPDNFFLWQNNFHCTKCPKI